MPVWNTHIISCFQYCAITFPEGIIGLYSNTDTFKIKNKLVNILLLCSSLLFDFSNALAFKTEQEKIRYFWSWQLYFRIPDFFHICILNGHVPLLWRVFTQFFTNETAKLENCYNKYSIQMWIVCILGKMNWASS